MIDVSIAGGSGYTGGELVRLLLQHPEVRIRQVTSERFAGKSAYKVHPNLRKATDLKFCTMAELGKSDVLFLALPHGRAMADIDRCLALAPMVIDLSGDFRLDDAEAYRKWYGQEHLRPELLEEFVYGVPEINRERLKDARYATGAGCNATVTILALWPLYRRGLVEQAVVEVKTGSSEAGNVATDASHHPERSGAVRSYKPTGHRHVAEILQVLGEDARVHFSATSIEMVRGVLATAHLFLTSRVTEKDLWRLYREDYGSERFIRIVKERTGIYRYPEPKLLSGTNYCDIGFELDPDTDRLVVMGAIDNLMKGAAGQAVQAFNVMQGFAEDTALTFTGLHPI